MLPARLQARRSARHGGSLASRAPRLYRCIRAYDTSRHSTSKRPFTESELPPGTFGAPWYHSQEAGPDGRNVCELPGGIVCHQLDRGSKVGESPRESHLFWNAGQPVSCLLSSFSARKQHLSAVVARVCKRSIEFPSWASTDVAGPKRRAQMAAQVAEFRAIRRPGWDVENNSRLRPERFFSRRRMHGRVAPNCVRGASAAGWAVPDRSRNADDRHCASAFCERRYVEEAGGRIPPAPRRSPQAGAVLVGWATWLLSGLGLASGFEPSWQVSQGHSPGRTSHNNTIFFLTGPCGLAGGVRRAGLKRKAQFDSL